jgi:hypothetical protein
MTYLAWMTYFFFWLPMACQIACIWHSRCAQVRGKDDALQSSTGTHIQERRLWS